MKPTQEEILKETRRTQSQIEALARLLNPEVLEEDPIAILAAALTDLATVVGNQTTIIEELRTEVWRLSNLLQEPS